jgi:hypothetical protein
MKKKRNAKRHGGRKNYSSSGKRRSEKEELAGTRRKPVGKQSGKIEAADSGNKAAAREFRPIKRRRRRRVRLGEAFRKYGLDEQTVAETYVGVVEDLRVVRDSKPEVAQKLLVEVLKECSRILEPPRGPGTNGMETPTIVEMHHEVSRPVRGLAATGENSEPF